MGNQLKKYEIEALIQEQLIKEQDEAFNIKEDKKPTQKTSGDRQFHVTDIVKKVVLESLQKEFVQSCVGPASEYEGHPKFEKTKKFIGLIQDLNWRLIDNFRYNSNENHDEEIQEILEKSYTPIIKLAIKKLYDLWYGSEDEEKKDDVVKEPVSDNELKFVILPKEEITSPQNKTYVVEEVGTEKIKLKDKSDNSVFMVDVEIAKKWKNNK